MKWRQGQWPQSRSHQQGIDGCVDHEVGVLNTARSVTFAAMPRARTTRPRPVLRKALMSLPQKWLRTIETNRMVM